MVHGLRQALRAGAACLALAACDDACDEPDRSAAPDAADAAVVEAEKPPPKPGCARMGSLDDAERDPSCALSSVPRGAVDEALKNLTLAAELDPPEVIAGSAAILRVTLTNKGTTEILVVFDATPRAPGQEVDWSRIAGMNAPPVDAPSDKPRLFFPVTTRTERGSTVDAVPTRPASTLDVTPKLVGVRLRPGRKLTHTESWWAFRIPAPPPIVVDDAGHRYVPKTLPVPLAEGSYTVDVELPLHGVSPLERTVRATAHVEREPKLPGRAKRKPAAEGAR